MKLEIGTRSDRLQVVSLDHSEHSCDYYLCMCDCGTEKIIESRKIKYNTVKSCGCKRGRQEGMVNVGDKYNKLTIKEFLFKEKYRKYYLCECDCGNTKICHGVEVKRGNPESCGCLYKKEPVSSGEKYGKLTVIKYEYTKDDKKFYSFKCDCGKEKIIQAGRVKRGAISSCGCSNSSVEVGQKYGNLTVINFDRVVKKKRFYNCKCDCGNEIIYPGTLIKRGLRTHCGCLKYVPNIPFKNEARVFNILKLNNIIFHHNYNVSKINKLEKNRFRIDFYIPEKNIILEYDGPQHFNPVKFGDMSWEDAKEKFQNQQIRDKYIKEFCNKENIKLINIDGRKYVGVKLEKYIKDNIIPLLQEQ